MECFLVMNKQIKLEEIVQLLDDGFLPDLIAFEFDLSQEYVAKCQQLLEQRKAQAKVSSLRSSSKMDAMRQKYKTLCAQEKKNIVAQTKCQSSAQASQINHIISTMEERLSSMPNMQSKDKQKVAMLLLKDLKELPNTTLSLEQAERLHTIWSTDILHHLNFSNTDFSSAISNARGKFCKIFARNYWFTNGTIR